VTIAQDEPLFLSRKSATRRRFSPTRSQEMESISTSTPKPPACDQRRRKIVDLQTDDLQTTIAVDQILVSTGRSPNVRD